MARQPIVFQAPDASHAGGGTTTSLQRDIAWRRQTQIEQASIAYSYAHYALGLTYEMMPADVVHQAKRALLDTLGCAIGAYQSPGRPMCEEVAKELGGVAESTTFGTGIRTSAANATLVNCFMVRFLDFNDMGGGSHNSDAIPGVLAIGEREKSNGKDVLTSIVITYELGSRFSAGAKKWYDWFADTRATVTMPCALGKLLKMTPEQIANAIGFAASGNAVLHIQDTALEDKTMRKNLRFGWAACSAITALLLARKGFTAPVRVIEGEKGVNEVMFDGKMDIEKMLDFSGWRIRSTRFKYLASNMSLQGGLGAVLSIVKEHDVKAADVAAVRLKLAPSDVSRATTPVKYPRNAETADHSIFYLTAFAIKNRTCGAESIEPHNFTDPVILDLIEKIAVDIDYKLPAGAHNTDAVVDITLKNGKKLTKHVVTPHGFEDDPLSDKELEDKFRTMASKYMSEDQIAKIFKTVWELEKLGDIGELMKLMVFKPR